MLCFSRFLRGFWTVCFSAFIGLFVVNSCLAAYTVNYLCGDGTGETPDDATDIQTGAGFVPAANTCTPPENYEFDGWSVSGTNEVIPASTLFTWEYPENKYFIAHYTKTSCSAGQSWETYTCDLSDAPNRNIGGDFGGRAINGATENDRNTKPLNDYPLAKGEWISVVGDNTIKGRAFCSNKEGNNLTLSFPEGYDWLANDSELIAAGTGEYCWCKITEYTSSSLQCDNIESDWVFINQNSSCSGTCAVYCAYKFYTSPLETSTRGKFRRELYNAVTRAEQEKCEINANLYSITYSNLLNATWDENQLHPDSYTTGEEITIGIPTREGYTFDGWCDDSELTQNCTTEKVISAGSTGDKTFYAKWTALPCGVGYESQTSPFNDTDYFAPGRAYSYFGAADRNEHFVSNGLNIDLDNTLEALPAGRFEIFFATDADSNTGFHAMLYGRAQCSSTVGYTGNWESSGHGQSVPDTISETPGNYCWCQFDKMVPYTKSGSQWVPNGEPIDFVTKWLSPGGQTCTPYSCAGYCTKKFHVQTPERKALYGPGALPPCKIKTYTISYELDGGEWPIALVSKPETYNITSATIDLPTPAEREGYTFDGWYDNNSFTGNPITQIPSGSYGNKTFYAKWARDSYTITFDLGDGNTNTETYTLGETVNLPQQTKDGYAFVGYCVNSSNCSSQERVMQLNYDVIPENPITLYPQFLKEVVVQEPGICEDNDCRVTIDLGDNDIIEQVYDNGDSLVLPAQNSESHAVFNGYCEGTPTCVDPVMNLTYEQVTSGSVFYSQMIETSAEEIPSNADRTCESDTCSIIVNIPTQAPVQTRGLRMLRNTRSASTSTYNETTVKTFNEGDLMILPVPIKQNYKLDGYCVGEEASCEEPVMAVTNDDLQDDSVTITPQWSAECPEEYPEKDESTGQCYRSWSCEEEPVCPENSKNCAYAGATSGRDYNDGTTPETHCRLSFECKDGYEKNSDSDTCEPITYTITYNSNGGTEYNDETYTVESETITLPTDVTRDGYTFGGWYGTEDFTGDVVTEVPQGSTGDKTFYAKWDSPEPDIPECGEGYKVYYNPLSSMDTSKAGTQYGYLSQDGALTRNADVYGLSDNGTWGATFDYGKVIGNSTCDEYHCICSLTGFIPDNNGVYGELQPVSTNRTITPVGYGYSGSITNANDGCRNGCAAGCANWVSSSSGQQRRKTLYANICLPITYTIHFVSNDGTEEYPDREYTVESETITLPTDVTREGYTFGGWYGTEDFTGDVVTEVPHGSTGEKTFYAKWYLTEPLSCPPDYELITNLSELDKRINSGNGMWPYGQIPTEAVCSASASGEPDTTTQGGYCWCRATGLITKDNVFHAVPTAPWTFGVALSNYDNCNTKCSGEVCRRFKANESRREAMYKGDLDTPACVEKTYMVQYIPNGGTIAPTDPRFFYTATSSSVSKPTSISRSGYTFAGWCESEEDANDANIVACQMETNVQPSDRQDKTFYAKWTEIPIEPEFECTSHAWLHIGDAKVCLSKTKVSSPAFALKTAKSTYYLQTSLDPDLQLNKDTSKKWRMDFNGTTYNIHDETVSGNGGSSSNNGDENDSGNDDGSSTGAQCNLSKLDKSLTGASHTQNSDGSWATTFSYGVIGGNAMCGTQCIGNKSVLNGVPDGAGSCCFCKITGYKAPDEDICLVSSAPWVQAHRLSSCSPYDCASTCSSFVKDWAGLRNSMYNE